MKNLTFSLLTIVLLINNTFSQNLKNDSSKRIYEYLITFTYANKINHKPIYYKTSLQTLRQVNFERLDLKNLDSSLKKAWEPFLSKLSSESIQEQMISFNIEGHPFTNQQNKPYLTFSPVLFSKDRKMAVCCIYDYDNPEAASETLYLISLKGGELKVIKWLLISIS